MQNFPALNSTLPVMTSREIAELVESRHDNVKRSIETLRDKGLISFTQSEETSHDGDWQGASVVRKEIPQMNEPKPRKKRKLTKLQIAKKGAKARTDQLAKYKQGKI